ncbi:DUF4381 family protein [Persicirhabdus sediminis]|uniref:DUF4381 family protein n=1 Tax=Persicirhabdus sediminis TaxID=454144 RepID=A0A8J7ME09_9BACT|nr:DUF4381 family protein [Persicirhabdus sediminis]MBK1791262.1 DUF4381 family protein [Persicirhabdus sediminis]
MNSELPIPSGLQDITNADSYLQEAAAPQWATGLAIAAGVIIVIAIIWALRSPQKKYGKSQGQLANEALTSLKERCAELSNKELATELSLILRRFLDVTYQDPSIYQTHEEFILREDALLNIDNDKRSHLLDFLTHLNAFKYKQQSTAAQDELIKQANELLTQLSKN